MNIPIIPRKAEFEAKIQKIKEAGLDALHVVSDFDRTLSKAYKDGKPFGATWDAFHFSSDYNKQVAELFTHYHPIEQDKSIPFDFRIAQMEEWNRRHLGLIVKEKISKEVFAQIVSEGAVCLREGIVDFFNFLKDKRIPLLIFSGGLGDVILEALKWKNILSANVHVIANFFRFDEKGIVIGLENEIISALTKTEKHLVGKPYMNEVVSRKNVILIGDTLSDLSMTSGFSHETILRIGFLNGKNEMLPQFEEAFDVIIPEDEGMEYVVELFRSL